MALNTQEICGIRVFGGDTGAVLKTIDKYRLNKPLWVMTVNPEFVVKALKDGKFKMILEESDLNARDGIALLWANEVQKVKGWHRLLTGWRAGMEILRGKYHSKIVAGSSLMDDLARWAEKKKMGIFYLGGWENRAFKTAKYFETKYPTLKTFWSKGSPEETNKMVSDKISNARPGVLLVAYGMARQEFWIKNNMKVLEKSGVRVVMGVGRSFDYYSGALKRAPEKWRKMGLEWLYSLIQEPKRWRRQLALPQFIWMVLRGK